MYCDATKDDIQKLDFQIWNYKLSNQSVRAVKKISTSKMHPVNMTVFWDEETCSLVETDVSS